MDDLNRQLDSTRAELAATQEKARQDAVAWQAAVMNEQAAGLQRARASRWEGFWSGLGFGIGGGLFLALLVLLGLCSSPVGMLFGSWRK